MPTPRAILWDTDSVLQRTSTEAWLLAVSVVSQIPGALTGAEVDEATIRALATSAGLEERIDEILDVWWAFDIVEPVLGLVSILRERGIGCYMATNQDAYRALCMRARTPYEQIFDGSYYSCDVGVAKPSAGFFEHIVSDLAIPAHELLFIDDHATNVASARAVGLRAEQWRESDGVERLLTLLHDQGVDVHRG